MRVGTDEVGSWPFKGDFRTSQIGGRVDLFLFFSHSRGLLGIIRDSTSPVTLSTVRFRLHDTQEVTPPHRGTLSLESVALSLARSVCCRR